MEKGAKPWNGEPQYGAASIGAKVRVWWAGLGQFIDGYIMAYDAERRQSSPEVDVDSSGAPARASFLAGDC